MISIVIPTYHEAARLPATLGSILVQSADHEVIVVDAESADGTADLARSEGARTLSTSRRQRAAQMNLGAAEARGDIVLFLHADTRLPVGALAKVERACRDPRVVGGGFARRFDTPSPLLRMTCLLAEMRTRCCGWFLGDQAIFARRDVFQELGGFPAWDVFEDLEFSRRLARRGRVVTLRPAVISAGRRFAARGAVRTTLHDLWLTARYCTGHLPERGPSCVPLATGAAQVGTSGSKP